MHELLRSLTFVSLCSLALAAATADVKVDNAWARATAPGQKTGSAYAELTSPSNAALVAAASPIAERVEMHSMSLEGGVMRMRAVPRIELPAGSTVKLSPSGLHLMLFGLKQPLKEGEKLPLELSIQSPGSAPATVNVEAEVRGAGSGSAEKR